MAERSQLAEVVLWGARIGVASWDPQRRVAAFQYDPDFLASGIQLAPLTMPLSERVYRFPELDRQSFLGLPGMLADALPDRFGNRLIDAWLIREGRAPTDFSPVERLLYIGSRAMGALEFRPARYSRKRRSEPLDVAELVQLANQVLADRTSLRASLDGGDGDHEDALNDILQVGVSAGGARAKAVIAWNPDSNEVRSGQVTAPEGFGYWILKFDGVHENRDKELLADPQGFGLIEYAYYLMAGAAGIAMMESRLLRENGRAHFMTRRFDRLDGGGRLHMQSLCALAHYDFNAAGAYGYEQALAVIDRLGLGKAALEEQFRRMVFNVAARNQDDHTKNIAFLMDKDGGWSLSPAFDVNFACNEHGLWTYQHQMSVNGKRRDSGLEDFLAVANRFRITIPRARRIVAEVDTAISYWPEFARQAGVAEDVAVAIGRMHRRYRPD